MSEKTVFRYCGQKRMILRKKKEVLETAKIWTFWKGVSLWILSKNRNFSYRCFLEKLCQKKSCFDILNGKPSF